MKYYIDCEFDGHNGALLSLAVVGRGLRDALYLVVDDVLVTDPWVRENVVPKLSSHGCWGMFAYVETDRIGGYLRDFFRHKTNTIIADSPVDIARFCAAYSTADDGGYAPCEFKVMQFEVHNIDCYPTKLANAVQHNAWWGAMALRYKLTGLGSERGPHGFKMSDEGRANISNGHRQ